MANPPEPHESLSDYIRRLRLEQKMSQKELALKANIHLQSLGKIERGQTTRLNQKTTRGLAYALSIPVEYLEAVCKGIPVSTIKTLKFCPNCWKPGAAPELMWTDVRSKYCFACGTPLRERCAGCNEPILSLKFRFCPYCGRPYQDFNRSTVAEPRNRNEP